MVEKQREIVESGSVLLTCLPDEFSRSILLLPCHSERSEESP